MNETLSEYGLSTAEQCDIIELVNSLGNQDKVPQAVKDSTQSICDRCNISLHFIQTKRSLVLTGIYTKMRSSYLFPPDKIKESQKLIKRGTACYLEPGADYLLKPENL